MSSGTIKAVAGIGAAAVIAICAAIAVSVRSDVQSDITDGSGTVPAAVSNAVTSDLEKPVEINDSNKGHEFVQSSVTELDYYDIYAYEDLSLLTQFPDLRKITLEFRAASEIDISAFPELPNLEELSLAYSEISDLEGVSEKFPNLISLGISSTHVKDLSPLANLKKLENLDISRTDVEDLSPLANLKNLKNLDMAMSYDSGLVRDFSPISELNDLETLNLYNNVFTDNSFIDDISKNKKLKSLNLGSVKYLDLNKEKIDIDSISGFENLTNLEELNISLAKTKDLSPISGATKMKNLNISYCTDIADLSVIAGMTDLEYLSLSINENISSDIAGVLDNFKKMKTLYLESHHTIDGFAYVDAAELLNSISKMKQLEDLTLNYILLVDDDIDTICSMNYLKNLSIKSSLSDKNTIKLLKDISDCQVDIIECESYLKKDLDALAAEKNPSQVEILANTFADLVYNELINNKTAAEPTSFSPISLDYEGMSWESDILLIDIDFDDKPELFTGGHGMNNGTYTIYSGDGTIYGTGSFFPSDFRIIDGAIYASGGSAMYYSYTKFCEGLPSISISYSGMDGEEVLYDVAWSSYNGELFSKYPEAVTEDKMKAVFPNHFGIEYAELNTDKYLENYVYSDLRVPDPENYSKEDVYDCIIKLLLQYEEQFGIR